MEIKDKVILITGAGSGLGKALALASGQAGAKVICAGRRKDKIQQTAEQVTKAGGLGTAVEMDVTDVNVNVPDGAINNIQQSAVNDWKKQ